MRQLPDPGGSPADPTGRATFAALRRGVGTRPRRWLLAGTLLLGVLAAFGTAAAADPGDLTLATLSDPTQSLMSVLVPYIGVLMGGDLRAERGPARRASTLTAAALLAVAIGLFGFLVCVAALAVVPSTAGAPWRSVATLAVGGVLVQLVAQLLGTGLGMLLRRHLVAFLLTIVLPLGLWFLLGGVDAFRPAQAWLAPYSSVRNLMSGDMTPTRWAQWAVVFLVWGVGLNVVGAAVLRRGSPGPITTGADA